MFDLLLLMVDQQQQKRLYYKVTCRRLRHGV